MWSCVLLLLCTYAHGAPVDVPKPGLCKDPSALGAARLALTKINQDRTQGYVLSLNRLCNVNQMPHEPMGMVYYLTMDILETKCHVLSKKDWKDCEVRSMDQTPVYGQCKATIYINKVQRIVNLHSYSCTMRPASASKIHKICPDCPSLMPLDSDTILKTVEKSLEEFNKKSGLSNYFALLNVTRASAQRGIAMFDFVEFTIQETTCSNSTDVSEAPKCTLMGCEFAVSNINLSQYYERTKTQMNLSDIYYEDGCYCFLKVGEKEKSRHLLGGEHNHSHHHSHEHGAGHHHHGHSHEHGHHHNHSHGHSHEEKEKSRPLLGGEHDHSHEHNHDHVHDHHHSHDHKDEHGHHHAHNHSQDHNHTHNHE
ncbi:fetuin-B-like, partial [Arapaima gigas]